MKKEMVKISGRIEFEGEGYDYTAMLRNSHDDARPSEVTDVDFAVGKSLPDDSEALEDLATENAQLLDWCAREGWEKDAAALIRAPEGLIQRITKADASALQTMSEPIAVGLHNWNDELLGDVKFFKGGIDEWIRSGYEPRTPFKEPKPVLKDGVIYSGDNGMCICRKCAGQAALYTGRDLSGQEVFAMPRSVNAEWRRLTGCDYTCDAGCTSYGEPCENNLPQVPEQLRHLRRRNT